MDPLDQNAQTKASPRTRALLELATLIGLTATLVSGLAYAFGDNRYANREKTERELAYIQAQVSEQKTSSRVQNANFEALAKEFREFKEDQKTFQAEQRAGMQELLRRVQP